MPHVRRSVCVCESEWELSPFGSGPAEIRLWILKQILCI